MNTSLQRKTHKCSLWVLRYVILLVYVCTLVEPRDNKPNNYWSFDYEYFAKFSSNDIKEDSCLDHDGNILHVNISFSVGGKRILLSLESETSTQNKLPFSFSKIAANGTLLSRQVLLDKNGFSGFVDENVAQKAFATFIKGHWFVEFEGSDGFSYSMEPELMRDILGGTVQANYHIFKIKVGEIHKASDLKEASQSQMYPNDGNHENRPIIGDSHIESFTDTKIYNHNGHVKEGTAKKSYNSLNMKLSVPYGVSYQRFVDVHDQTSDDASMDSNLRKTNHKTPCNVLVVTNTELWKRLGIEDPLVVVSLYKFAYQHVNRMLSQTDSGNQDIRRLTLERIYMYEASVTSDQEKRYGDESSAILTSTDISNILCNLRSNQSDKDFCLAQATVAHGRHGVVGTTVFANDELTNTPLTNLKQDSAESKSRDTTLYQTNSSGNMPERRKRPTSFEINTLLGCRKEVLSVGLFAHFIARQLTQSILGRVHGSDRSRLTCGPSNGDNVMLSAQHFKTEDGRCGGAYAETIMKKVTIKQPSIVKSKNPRAKRSKSDASGTCRNGKIDPGEECDPGHVGTYDHCCMPNCKLRRRAVCSPKNQLCCTPHCQIAPSTKVCKSEVFETNICQVVKTHCDGVDPSLCDSSHYKSLAEFETRFVNFPDFSRCGMHGLCYGGKCLSFCDEMDVRRSNRSRGLVVCQCNVMQTGDQPYKKQCADCCDDFKSANACVVTKGQKVDEPCVFDYCPKLGCIRFHAEPKYPIEPEDYEAIVAPEPKRDTDHSDGISERTLIIVLRTLYWVLSGGLLVGFFVFSTFTIFPFFAKNKKDVKQKTQQPKKHGDFELQKV